MVKSIIVCLPILFCNDFTIYFLYMVFRCCTEKNEAFDQNEVIFKYSEVLMSFVKCLVYAGAYVLIPMQIPLRIKIKK